MSAAWRRTVALVGVGFLAAGALAAATTSRDDNSNPPGTTSLDTQDPAALLEAARTAVATTERVHVVGSTDDGTGSFKVDVRALPQQNQCAGTFVGQGNRMEFLVAESTAYIRGNRALWVLLLEEGGAEDVDVDELLRYIGDRWVQGDLGPQERAMIMPFCELDRLLGPSVAGRHATLGGRAFLWGRTARQIRFVYQGEEAVLALDEQAPHRPLQFELADPGSGLISTELDFDYDDEVTIVEPAPEDTVTRNGPVFGT